MIRWGILGTAKIAKEQLVPAIQAARNASLTGIASRNQDSASAFASQFGIPMAFSSYEAMLASDEIDAIYIPLPTSQHVEWTLKCLKAGKHVLCEKPIALHADEIDSLIETRDRTELVVSEAFMVVYHPQWHKVRQLLKNGAIGTLRHIQASFAYFNRDPGNMRNILELGGGGLPDIGVYPTVTARFATGKEPLRAWASVTRDPAFGTDIYANCQYDFGAFDMSFYVATQMAARQQMIFHGDEGFIEVTAPYNAELYEGVDVILHSQHHDQKQVFAYRGVNQYTLEIEALSDRIAGRDVRIFSLESSKANQAAIDALYDSDMKNIWVDI